MAEEYFSHEDFAIEKFISNSYSSFVIPASEKSWTPRAAEVEESFCIAKRLSEEYLFSAAPRGDKVGYLQVLT